MTRSVPHDDPDTTTTDKLRTILRMILNEDQQALLEAFGRVREAPVRQAILLVIRAAAEDRADVVKTTDEDQPRRARARTEIVP
jgi:hypothetical protein